MRIYRKIIPKIAKDVVRCLLAQEAIEAEDGHRDDVELDVAGAVVEYLDDIDRVKQDARATLERKGMGLENLLRAQERLAIARNVVMGDSAFDHVVTRIIESLFNSKAVTEVFLDDKELQSIVGASVQKYVGVDEELDREIRGKLRNLREGTPEWEAEYSRLIEHMRAQMRQDTNE